MLSSPRISDSPTPINAYSIPVTIPLRTAPASSAVFTGDRGAPRVPRRVAGRCVVLGLVHLRQLLRHRRAGAVVGVGADPEILAGLGVDLHEVFGAHAPAIEERDLWGETEVVGLADRNDDVLTGVEQAEHVGLGGGRLAQIGRASCRGRAEMCGGAG